MSSTVYLNGEFLPASEAKISPRDRGFLFSDGVYEALCAYEGRLFLAGEHFARLERSLRALRLGHVLEEHLTQERFSEIARELVRRNDLRGGHAKIYLQVTRGAPPARSHAFPRTPTDPTVYATAARYELPEEQWARGVKVLLCRDERWGRCDVKSVSLLPNVLANQRAMEAGAFEALLVREHATGEDTVTEGSHSSFAAVMNGTVVTHPLGPEVLPGVTRGLVLQLAREEGVPVREDALPARRLRDADELFLIGTTTGVMPVARVEEGRAAPRAQTRDAGWDVAGSSGAGTPGPVTRQLQDAFRAAISFEREATLEPEAFLGSSV